MFLIFSAIKTLFVKNSASFSEISNVPHSEITITDVEPQDWYYMQLISTTGAPNETQGTVLVKAGETKTITVQLF